MNWRDRVSAIYAKLPPKLERRPAFRASASSAQIAELESTIGFALPAALAELLLESNGIMDEQKSQGAWIETAWVVWPVEWIAEWNLRARQDWELNYDRYFEHLLFFADAGSDGILFAHPKRLYGEFASDVVVWIPLGDELSPFAPSLEAFLDGWLTGAIEIR
jgi:hypothetical protein